MKHAGSPRGPAVDYGTLAELRYHVRRFLRARENAARAAGVAPQHYLLLLQIKGLENERPATVGTLAERLQLRHHTVVELVDRLAARGMVARHRPPSDRRQVVVTLRPAGEAVLKRLAEYSIEELRTEGPALVVALTRLIGRAVKARRTRVNGSRSLTEERARWRPSRRRAETVDQQGREARLVRSIGRAAREREVTRGGAADK